MLVRKYVQDVKCPVCGLGMDPDKIPRELRGNICEDCRERFSGFSNGYLNKRYISHDRSKPQKKAKK